MQHVSCIPAVEMGTVTFSAWPLLQAQLQQSQGQLQQSRALAASQPAVPSENFASIDDIDDDAAGAQPGIRRDAAAQQLEQQVKAVSSCCILVQAALK